VELRDRISADLAGDTIMISDAFSTFLKTSTNYGRLMIHFADDQDRTDDS
jgi:hypothetical protein